MVAADVPVDKQLLAMQFGGKFVDSDTGGTFYIPVDEDFPTETEWLQIRMLGMEGHYVPTDDSVEFNKTIVEFPYVKYAFNFNAYPLNVNNPNDMILFNKVNLLKTMQYKFMIFQAEF